MEYTVGREAAGTQQVTESKLERPLAHTIARKLATATRNSATHAHILTHTETYTKACSHTLRHTQAHSHILRHTQARSHILRHT